MNMEKMLRRGRIIGETMMGSAIILLVGLCLSLETNPMINTFEFFTIASLYLLLLGTGVVLKEVSSIDTISQPHTQTH